MGVVSCKLQRPQLEFRRLGFWCSGPEPLTRLNVLFISLLTPHIIIHFYFLLLVVAIVSVVLLKRINGAGGKHER